MFRIKNWFPLHFQQRKHSSDLIEGWIEIQSETVSKLAEIKETFSLKIAWKMREIILRMESFYIVGRFSTRDLILFESESVHSLKQSLDAARNVKTVGYVSQLATPRLPK